MSRINIQDVIRKLGESSTPVPAPPNKPVADACWVARSCVHEGGEIENRYTDLKIGGAQLSAHKWAAFVAHGEEALIGTVMHKCDRKSCMNPSHVMLGTPSENTQSAWDAGLISHPKRRGMPGEKNSRAILKNIEAAQVKWLFDHPDEWYPQLSDSHTIREALAIHFHVPLDTIRRTVRLESWKCVTPQRPDVLPSAKTVPPDAVPMCAVHHYKIGDPGALYILTAFGKCKNASHFVRDMAKLFECSTNVIYLVLRRKLYKHVFPEIGPVTFLKHGMQKLDDRAIQEIRATAQKYRGVKGIKSALARRYGLTNSHVGHIVAGVTRMDVPDDPNAFINIDELEFLPLTQKGSSHPLAKLDDDHVLAILQERRRGIPVKQIALEHRVSIQVIYAICKGKTRPNVYARFMKDFPPDSTSQPNPGTGGNEPK